MVVTYPIGRDALSYWRQALESWAIPSEILDAAAESPWTLPAAPFIVRARRQVAEPSGESYRCAAEDLPPGGSVLDVGAGAGAASLALSEKAGHIVAVDTNASFLDTFRGLAEGQHIGAETIIGEWPDVAERAAVADIVVCHHVLYNVADLAPFVTALSAHARRRVVVEISDRHPMTPWNPLWKRFHGLDRPTAPTASDAVAAITSLGLAPHVIRWQRPATLEAMTFDDLVSMTGRRLCLGPDRVDDVAAAIRDLGVDPAVPTLGGTMRDTATIWWAGAANDTP